MNIVLGIAGNKFDLFTIEEVSEEEGNKFAKEIGAFFYLTSAKESVGINELFTEVAKRYMNLINNNSNNDKIISTSFKVSKSTKKENKKEKNCC